MGYFFARSHFAGERLHFFHKALIIPILLHGFYDVFLFITVSLAGSVPEGEELPSDDAAIILVCIALFFAVLGTSLRMVHKYLKEMQAEQNAMSS